MLFKHNHTNNSCNESYRSENDMDHEWDENEWDDMDHEWDENEWDEDNWNNENDQNVGDEWCASSDHKYHTFNIPTDIKSKCCSFGDLKVTMDEGFLEMLNGCSKQPITAPINNIADGTTAKGPRKTLHPIIPTPDTECSKTVLGMTRSPFLTIIPDSSLDEIP